MKRILLFIILLHFSNVFTQHNIVVESTLVDFSTGETIPFASISLQKSYLATTSNIDGLFSLAISKKALPDTLIIKHLSFETQKVYLDENHLTFPKKILLKAKSIELATTTIYGKNATQIIEKVIDNLDFNYHLGTFYLKGFYRQTHQENNQFVRLIESFATIKEQINLRKTDNQKDFFNISDIRRSNIYERNGDTHGDHLMDLFSENPINYTATSFLNKNNIHNYTFSFEDYDNPMNFKIVFKNKKWSSSENKHGFIIINKDDFAVLELKIISTNNFAKKVSKESKWRFQNGKYHIFYEKSGDKYYCKRSSKYYNHFVLNQQTQNIEYIVEEYFDWFTNQFIDEKDMQQKIKFTPLSNIYSKEYIYDKNSWVNIPVINEKVINDLNQFKALEIQFVDD